VNFKPNLLLVPSALVLACLFGPAVARTTVYKCGSGSATYSDLDCSGRVVNTEEAPVPVKPADVRRKERVQALALSMRREPGESAAEFEIRRHRVALRPEDRAECARLDKRMPVEQGSLTNPDPDEAANAREALGKSRQRFAELGC
jgi:hypothetical protein